MATQTAVELTTIPSTAAPQVAGPIRGAATPAEGGGIEDTRDEANPPANKELFDSYPENAWLQVLACSILFSTTVGGTSAYGVFQDALVSAKVGESSTLSWVGSLQAALQSITAIPNARILAAYGPRNTALLGALFASLGPLLAGWCTESVTGLMITEGIMFGYGRALMFTACATLPSSYFLRRRNMATGIVYAGAGVGGAIFSIVGAQLLQRLSLPWTFRTMGLIYAALNFPCAMMLKGRAPREPFRSGKKVFEWSLLKDSRLAILLLGTSISLFPLLVPPFFLPLYGTTMGLSTIASSCILAGYNLASGLGRIAFGLTADGALGSLNSLVLCLSLVGISTLLIWPLATSLPPLIFFAVVNGICAGGMFSLIPGVLASVFGTTGLKTMFMMYATSGAPGYLLGSPIAGFLIQAYGGADKGYSAYRPAIFYSGALSMLSAGLVLTVRLRVSKELWKKL
ncbi:hypothetical protein JCM8547_006643 [Rhodosporidiobolus lusitaniae]